MNIFSGEMLSSAYFSTMDSQMKPAHGYIWPERCNNPKPHLERNLRDFGDHLPFHTSWENEWHSRSSFCLVKI